MRLGFSADRKNEISIFSHVPVPRFPPRFPSLAGPLVPQRTGDSPFCPCFLKATQIGFA